MKAFDFRLNSVLRWREAQTTLQKARVLAAAGRRSSLAALRDGLREECVREAALLPVTAVRSVAALPAYAAFSSSSARRIDVLENQLRDANESLKVEMARLIEADRAVKMLERARKMAQSRWRQAQDRELGAFADEAFLARRESGIMGVVRGA